MEKGGKFNRPQYRQTNIRHNGLIHRLVPFFLSVALLSFTTAISSGNFPFLNAIAAPMFLTNSCDIKGKVSYHGGTKIFHVSGQEYYSATKISYSRGERWFCSEAAAKAAGWRKAKR